MTKPCSCDVEYRNVGEWLNKKTKILYRIMKCPVCGEKYEEKTEQQGGTSGDDRKIQRLFD